MRRRILLGVAVGAVIALGSAGGAFAGARGGDGPEPPAGAQAPAAGAVAGLQDMDFEAPVDPGVVQNWGHIPREVRKMFSDRGAAVVESPFGEDGCNANMFPNKTVPNH